MGHYGGTIWMQQGHIATITRYRTTTGIHSAAAAAAAAAALRRQRRAPKILRETKRQNSTRQSAPSTCSPSLAVVSQQAHKKETLALKLLASKKCAR